MGGVRVGVRLWGLELEPRERAPLGLGCLILRSKKFIQKACPRAYEEARWGAEGASRAFPKSEKDGVGGHSAQGMSSLAE